MLDFDKINNETPLLQSWAWPPVSHHGEFDNGFADFMALNKYRQTEYLASLRKNPSQHSKVLHEYLGIVSGYFFGYEDSPLYLDIDDNFEIDILTAKITLEREAKDYWLQLPTSPEIKSIEEAVDHLKAIAADNPSLNHPLFTFLKDKASDHAMRVFLWNEIIRNEIVDDEVAMLSVGTQGWMKVCTVSNLWDEIGHGKLKKFHTYWLRRLLDSLGGLEDFMDYRKNSRPWFTKITTNIFNILLSRPGLKYMKYGWFLTNEGWVEPHFKDIVAGMNRVHFLHDDTQIYFTAHIAIDPVHTEELIEGLRCQVPMLASKELQHIVIGAQMAVAAAKVQYDHVYQYLIEITNERDAVNSAKTAEVA